MSTINTASGASAATSSASGSATTKANEASDRFLKLLVTQMQNQDPLNPMDNAQVTSQMAQINTVTGIDKLNTTMTSVNTSLSQMQMLQGSSLVGREVLIEGNQVNVDSKGKATAGYELSSAATSVKIDIVDAGGAVVDSITQANKASGRQGFDWTPKAGMPTNGLSFKVTATSGTKAVPSTPLMTDTVNAITTSNGSLTLELSNGKTVAYGQVKAVS